MSASKEKLDICPIFTALTRPPMVMGVTLEYLAVCGLGALVLFIGTDNPLFLLVFAPFYLFGWIACRFDPNMFSILRCYLEYLQSPNKKIWGCHSYEPF